jgi:hypothetical protein
MKFSVVEHRSGFSLEGESNGFVPKELSLAFTEFIYDTVWGDIKSSIVDGEFYYDNSIILGLHLSWKHPSGSNGTQVNFKGGDLPVYLINEKKFVWRSTL